MNELHQMYGRTYRERSARTWSRDARTAFRPLRNTSSSAFAKHRPWPGRAGQTLEVHLGEDTFERDLSLAAMDDLLRRLPEKVWNASRRDARVAKTVVLKLKTSEFKTMTRSLTPVVPPETWKELAATALALKERVHVAAAQRFRLVGMGVSNFRNTNFGTPCQRLQLSDSLPSELESLCSSRPD